MELSISFWKECTLYVNIVWCTQNQNGEQKMSGNNIRFTWWSVWCGKINEKRDVISNVILSAIRIWTRKWDFNFHIAFLSSAKAVKFKRAYIQLLLSLHRHVSCNRFRGSLIGFVEVCVLNSTEIKSMHLKFSWPSYLFLFSLQMHFPLKSIYLYTDVSIYKATSRIHYIWNITFIFKNKYEIVLHIKDDSQLCNPS
jgi:hypothetical protein